MNFPPDKQLDKETYLRLNDVRKEVWTGGLVGLATGLVAGYWSHYMTRFVPSLKTFQHPKYATLAILLGGSLGSFLGATVSGKNSIVYIGDIFKRSATPSSSYQRILIQNELEVVDKADDTFKRRQAQILSQKAVKSSTDQWK